jgi:hypothetical protein
MLRLSLSFLVGRTSLEKKRGDIYAGLEDLFINLVFYPDEKEDGHVEKER